MQRSILKALLTIVTIGLVVPLAACTSSVSDAQASASETPSEATSTLFSEGDSVSAIAACHTVLEGQLRDPDSAKFSDETATMVAHYSSGATWEVAGTVRATNGFGGYVVNQYSCNSLYSSTDGSYSATITSTF
jgi:riboflavin synthase alpha subunit